MEEIRRIVHDLHPAASERDNLPPLHVDDKANAIRLIEREVRRSIYKLNTKSSHGFTSWSPALLVALFTRSKKDNSALLLTNTTALFNFVLAGRGSERFRSLWAQARETLIPKPASVKMRPIGIGDAWDRLMGKAVSMKIAPKIASLIAPHQLGLGTRGGVEIAARLLQLYFFGD
jgi:hypothetical protein